MTVAAADRVLAGLDDEQRAAVVATRGPVCILAGAGTGKTRAITHRIAYGVLTGAVPAGQVLAVTFTARAAGQLRGRLRALGVGADRAGGDAVQALTFHAAALRQLRYFWPRVVGGELPRLAERKAPLVAQALTRARQRAHPTMVRDVTGEIEWAKARLVGPEAYASAAGGNGRLPPLPPEVMATVYAGYERAKQRAGQVDFDDLLLVMAAAIEEHRDVAEQVRARYRHFVVDEYQDVNPLQQRLLEAWLGGRDDLCVVGDASQTIYTFNGATPAYLTDFPVRYPAAAVVRLHRDYRSTPQVVTLANRVIAAARGAPAAARLRLVGQRAAGPEPTLLGYPDEPAEAAAVADGCRALLAAGTPAGEIAVLFRTNAQSATYEQALAEAGVPYVVRGGERFFDRPEVRKAMVLLRGAARSADGAQPLPAAVIAVLSSAGFTPDAPPPGGAAREQWEALAALLRLAEEMARDSPQAGLPGFVDELAQRAQAQHAPTVDGVTLASLHAAKGLEWDAVFLAGLVDGVLPITHAATDEQVEEERRLLYVGITRARERLALSWAAARSPGGRGRRQVSRFLNGVLIGPASLAGGRSSAGWAAPGSLAGSTGRAAPGRRAAPVCRACGAPLSDPRARKLRRCDACLGDVDEQLLERLRDWRLRLSRANNVPAYVVFTDATLTAIAETRPSTPAALAHIPGVGPRKLDEYADDVLALVRGELPAAEPLSGSVVDRPRPSAQDPPR